MKLEIAIFCIVNKWLFSNNVKDSKLNINIMQNR